MKTIWKYEIEFKDRSSIDVPRGARFLTLELQHGLIMSWFEVEDDVAERDRWHILLTGTGHRVEVDAYEYLGTVHIDGGNFVFHIYRGRIEQLDVAQG